MYISREGANGRTDECDGVGTVRKCFLQVEKALHNTELCTYYMISVEGIMLHYLCWLSVLCTSTGVQWN